MIKQKDTNFFDVVFHGLLYGEDVHIREALLATFSFGSGADDLCWRWKQ